MKKLISTFAVLFFSFGTIAAAEEVGLYIGAGVGYVDHDMDIDDWDAGPAGGSSTYDDEDLGVRVYLGYQINDYLGVEAGFARLGVYQAEAVNGADTGMAEIETNSVHIFGTVGYPVTEDFTVFGKAGISRNQSSMEFSSSGINFNATDAGADTNYSLAFGAGASYRVYENARIRLEFEDFGGAGESNDSFNTAGRTSQSHPRMLSLGVQYNF